MANILQNKVKINGIEYMFNVLESPEPENNTPVSSKYIYQLVRQLNGFIGKAVTDKIEISNKNVPTSSAVYTAIKNLTTLDPINVPSGYTLVFRGIDGKLYYQNGNELTLINVTGQGPLTAVNVDYDENNHSLVYGSSQINASEAIDYPEEIE